MEKSAQKWLFSHFYQNLDPSLPTLHLCPVGLGRRETQIFFFKVANRPQEAMQKNFLEFSLLISDICLYCHFCHQLNLPFSESNITPSVRPNLGIFKNFWYWISTFRQSFLVKKISLNWIKRHLNEPRLGWDYISFIVHFIEE